MSSSSNGNQADSVVSLLLSRRGKPVIRQIVNNRNTRRALALAHSCLTDREKELVALKIIIGADQTEIMKALDFKHSYELRDRWQSVLRILRILVQYFACYNHKQALKEIEEKTSRVSAAVCFDLLCGSGFEQAAKLRGCTYKHVKQVLWLLRKTIYHDSSDDVRAFIDTLVKVRRFERL